MSISQENFIHIGWRELHNAALARGAEIDYDPFSHPELEAEPYLDPLIYSELLTNFPAKCGIEMPSQNCVAEVIYQRVWEELKNEACTLARLEWEDILSLRTPAGVMNAFRSRDFLYRHPSHSAWKQGSLKLLSEKGLAIIAYDEKDKQKYIVAVIWALACLGAISKWFTNRSTCKFCYRLVWPGQSFCRQHSQAKPYEDSRSNAYLRYRTGRRAFLLAQERGLLGQIKGSNMFQSLRAYGAMADLLFPLQLDENDNLEREALTHALAQSPRALELLGGEEILTLPYSQLVSLLQESLDSNEWDSVMWPSKIIAAEIWLELEEEISPGKRPSSSLTRTRIEKALTMSQGGYTQKQIAEFLKITPSALSKWKARGLIPADNPL